MQFKLLTTSIEEANFKKELCDSKAGALSSFEGWVRDHNEDKKVIALEYEALGELCEKEAQNIFDEVRKKFHVIDGYCVHRIGRLKIGQLAVWIAVTAAHRDDAFKACRYIIDEIKHRLPIWKKEYYENGDSGWVNCNITSKKALPIPKGDPTLVKDG